MPLDPRWNPGGIFYEATHGGAPLTIGNSGWNGQSYNYANQPHDTGQGTYNPRLQQTQQPVDQNYIASLRQMMQSGQITPQQAWQQMQGSIRPPTNPTQGSMDAYHNSIQQAQSSLFAPMTINQGGRPAMLNHDGSFSYQGAQNVQTNVGGAGSYSNNSIQGGNNNVQGYNGTSVVDYLNILGHPSDYAHRAQMAAQFGIQNYTGTATQNSQMLNMLRSQGQQGVQGGITGNGQMQTGGQGLPSTGNPTLDSLQAALQSYVGGQLAQGFAVNPEMQITPDLINQFLNEAHQSIDPYYQQQLGSEMANIQANLSTLSQQYQTAQANQQATFQQGVADVRENAGGSGTAFSGGRGLTENNLLQAQNRALGSLDLSYGQQMGDVMRGGAAQLGSGIDGLGGGIGSVGMPTLQTQQSSLDGPRGGVASGHGLNLNFDPSIYRYGTIGSNYASNLTGQANQYLSDYLQSAGNNGGRRFQNINGAPILM